MSHRASYPPEDDEERSGDEMDGDVSTRLKEVLRLGASKSNQKRKGRKEVCALKPFKKAAGSIIHGHNIMLSITQVLLLGAEHVNNSHQRWVEPQVPKESDVIEEDDEVLVRLVAEGKTREAANCRRHLYNLLRLEHDAIIAYGKLMKIFPTFHSEIMPALLAEPAVFEEFTQTMQTAGGDARTADIRKAKLHGPEILRKSVLGRHQDFEPPIDGNGDYKQRGPRHPQLAGMLVPIEHYVEFQEDPEGTQARMLDVDRLDSIACTPQDLSSVLYETPEDVDTSSILGKVQGAFTSSAFIAYYRLQYQGLKSTTMAVPGGYRKGKRGAAESMGWTQATARSVANVWTLMHHSMQGTVEDWRRISVPHYLARFFQTVDLLNTDFDDAQGIWARRTLQSLTDSVFLPQESMPLQLVPQVKRGMDDFPSLEERMKARDAAAAQQASIRRVAPRVTTPARTIAPTKTQAARTIQPASSRRDGRQVGAPSSPARPTKPRSPPSSSRRPNRAQQQQHAPLSPSQPRPNQQQRPSNQARAGDARSAHTHAPRHNESSRNAVASSSRVTLGDMSPGQFAHHSQAHRHHERVQHLATPPHSYRMPRSPLHGGYYTPTRNSHDENFQQQGQDDEDELESMYLEPPPSRSSARKRPAALDSDDEQESPTKKRLVRRSDMNAPQRDLWTSPVTPQTEEPGRQPEPEPVPKPPAPKPAGKGKSSGGRRGTSARPPPPSDRTLRERTQPPQRR